MLQQQAPPGQRFGDVSRQTMRVVEIIAAWVVNTFYNYLHQEAVDMHTKGRAGSITDGYRYIVKQYLDSFNSVEGYKRLVVSLHKYYVDNSHCAAIAFDEWTREVLEQFVPLDYKAIMSNEQQDILLRDILINAIEQFSSDVICTRLLDLLISNHDEPSIAPQMKASMKAVLLAERQKIFNNIHRASTGSDSGPQMSIKREICGLIEENVILKSKNGKLTESVKKSIEGMKMRDKAISVLKMQISEMQRQMQQLQMQIPRDTSSMYIQPRTQAEEFRSSLADVAVAGGVPMRSFPPITSAAYDPQLRASGGGAAPLRPMLRPSQPRSAEMQQTRPSDASQMRPPDASQMRPPASLPSYMTSQPIHSGQTAVVNNEVYHAPVAAAPMSHLEKTPEPFEQADPEPEPDDVDSIPSPTNAAPTGNDTLALNMDEFMNS